MDTRYCEENLESRFDYLVEKYRGKRILLYGASIFLKKMISLFDFSQFDIVGIADKSFYRGDSFNSWDTYNYSDIKDVEHDVCLITIFNSLEKVEKIFRDDGIKFESFISQEYLSDIEKFNEKRFHEIMKFYQLKRVKNTNQQNMNLYLVTL